MVKGQYVTASPNLHSLILDSSQYIILSDVDQDSTRMRSYLHYQHNWFIDYSDDPGLDGALIHAGGLPFQYDEQEGTYTEFFGNPTGYIFLAICRDHKLLLGHRSTSMHVSCTPLKSRKSKKLLCLNSLKMLGIYS